MEFGAKAAGLLIILSFGVSGAAMAQAANSPAPSPGPASEPAEAASDGGQLQDIVVTAQRRSERLQDIPVAVATLNANALAKGGVANGYDLQSFVPALSITTSSGAAIPFIRGVGNSVSAAGNEASTAVYIDGVYIARVNPALLELNNIERVEVLKGPQGTLFGRNATGGLIHIITSDPSDRMELRANAGYANYDTVTGSIYAAAPLSEDVGASLSLIYRHQGDGWGRNTITGDDTWFNNYFGARSKFVARLGETTKISVAGDYLRARTDLSLFQATYRGTTHGNPPGFPPVVFHRCPASTIRAPDSRRWKRMSYMGSQGGSTRRCASPIS